MTRAMLALLAFLAAGANATAQQSAESPTVPQPSIIIRMLDSRTGTPILNEELRVYVDHASRTNSFYIKPNKLGESEFDLEVQNTAIAVHDETPPWGRINCDSNKDRTYQQHWYSVADILKTGVVAPNRCNQRKATAKPGEFIFFVRYGSWWEKFKT
jgi:hypothetical protein